MGFGRASLPPSEGPQWPGSCPHLLRMPSTGGLAGALKGPMCGEDGQEES